LRVVSFFCSHPESAAVNGQFAAKKAPRRNVPLWMPLQPPKDGCINNLQGDCGCVIGFANRPFVDIYNRSSAVFPVGGAMRKSAGATVSLDSFAE